VTLTIIGYSIAVIPAIHTFTAGVLWTRIAISLALIVPCGLVMGFCFPAGVRRLTALNKSQQLPWMWALNGAAGTLGTFVAIVVSMETNIATCTLAGAACYATAAVALPLLSVREENEPVRVPSSATA
jgi:hypothetical protein